ncbi:hypothetical protein AAVH_01302 [Aphelenchoides avenae]|nr:hypothetical protein AAVH_01302 [Aphelenchus avenae]
MWNQSPCKGRHYFQDYPPAYKPHIRQHPRTNKGPPAHFRDVVFPIGRGPPRTHVEPPPGTRVSNPYAPSSEMPPSWFVQTNVANQDRSTSSLENLRPPSTSAWPQSVIYLPAEPISGVLIQPPFPPSLAPPGVTPSWFVQPNLAKQELAPQPPEPSEDTDDSLMRLPPPPPPPEMPSSSNNLPITVKQERSTRAKNWVLYPQVPQAPPEPPSSNIVEKLERSTSTPVSDLPSLQLPPNEQLRDPSQLKRSDSDPLHTTTAKLSRDDKANAPNKDDLEDVRKLLALGEKRRIKLEAEEAKLKRSKTSHPDVSRFKKMEAHYKDKMKAWAEKYNALKQSYEALRQERGQQVAGHSTSLQMVKNDVDEDERAVNDSIQVR